MLPPGGKRKSKRLMMTLKKRKHERLKLQRLARTTEARGSKKDQVAGVAARRGAIAAAIVAEAGSLTVAGGVIRVRRRQEEDDRLNHTSDVEAAAAAEEGAAGGDRLARSVTDQGRPLHAGAEALGAGAEAQTVVEWMAAAAAVVQHLLKVGVEGRGGGIGGTVTAMMAAAAVMAIPATKTRRLHKSQKMERAAALPSQTLLHCPAKR